jgi:hypothetical protein
MAFIQLIEFKTSRIGELEAVTDEWRERTAGKRTARSGRLTEDRDRPGTYMQIVEFDSYDEAMANSALPETGELSGKIAALCDSPPVFHNLDVRREENF